MAAWAVSEDVLAVVVTTVARALQAAVVLKHRAVVPSAVRKAVANVLRSVLRVQDAIVHRQPLPEIVVKGGLILQMPVVTALRRHAVIVPVLVRAARALALPQLLVVVVTKASMLAQRSLAAAIVLPMTKEQPAKARLLRSLAWQVCSAGSKSVGFKS